MKYGENTLRNFRKTIVIIKKYGFANETYMHQNCKMTLFPDIEFPIIFADYRNI